MAFVFPEDRQTYLGGIKFTLVDEFDQPIADQQVTLYLPQGLQIADKVEYETVELGALGAAASGTTGDDLSLASESLSSDDVKKTLISNIVGKFTERGGQVARARTRTAPNPNARALFKQVGLRTFQFAFKLIPTKEAEAQTITDIIKLFRTEMYPENIPFTVPGTGETLSLGYKFPNRFKVEMLYDGKTVGPNIAPSYLDSFVTNYNPTNQTFLTGESRKAFFSEIDISFTLTESKTLSRESIGEGF